MIWSSERSTEEIYESVRQKKRALGGRELLPVPPPANSTRNDLVAGAGALQELGLGIEQNRDVHAFPLESPFPVLGPLFTLGKRALRRLLRFYLLRQTGFNQYVLEYLKALSEQSVRLSARSAAEEAKDRERAARERDTAAAIEAIRDRLADFASEASLGQRSLEGALDQIRSAIEKVVAGQHEAGAREEGAARATAGRLAEVQARLAATEDRLAAERLPDALRRRWEIVAGLFDIPLDLYVVARARGPVPTLSRGGGQAPALPAASPPRPPLPRVDFAPPGGRAYGKLAACFAGCRRVIDVGCGNGDLLELLRSMGIEGVGVDADARVVEALVARGLDARHADAFAALSAAEGYDGVAITHLIEHYRPADAFALLIAARRALREEGTLLLVTPNPESPLTQLVHFWRDPEHERPYPLALLRALVEAAGFAVLEAGPDPDTREPLHA